MSILTLCARHFHATILLAAAGLCAGILPSDLKAGDTGSMMTQEPWFQGTVEAAFEKATNLKKPVFLYWGAVWCPPCNQLKATVFADDRFRSLMAGAVAVYLDGDTDRAQLWSDKLKVTGYPTILVLQPPKSAGLPPQEIARLDAGLSVDEFASAIEETLNGGMTLARALSDIQKGEGGAKPWKVVSGTAWNQLDETSYPPAQRLNLLTGLVQKAKDPAIRASLTASLLSEAISAHSSEDKILQEAARKIKPLTESYLENIFASGETTYAARGLLVFSATDTFKFIFGEKVAAEHAGRQNQLITRWLEKVDGLRTDKRLFIDTWLWSHIPELELWKLKNGDKPAPAPLVAKIKNAVLDADKKSTTPYERHAVISGAAAILKDIGDIPAAEALLQKEIQQTDTPWYYLSSLASLAMAGKKFDAAMNFSEKARLSARTQRNATRIQWIVNDVVLLGKIEPLPEKKLAETLDDYYSTVFALPDGFAGRNGTRAKTVAKEVKRHSQVKQIQERISHWSGLCKTSTNQEACRAHFKIAAQGV